LYREQTRAKINKKRGKEIVSRVKNGDAKKKIKTWESDWIKARKTLLSKSTESGKKVGL